MVDVTNHKPLMHVSGMFPVEQGCMAVVVPLCWHPTNKNSFIAFDLNQDPAPLFALSAEEIQQRVFTRTADLPEGVERLSLKEIHINKSPVLAPAKTLTPDQAERWAISGERLRQHLAMFRDGGSLTLKLHQVFGDRGFVAAKDVDGRLYDGFFSSADKQAMNDLHQLSDWDLADWPAPFRDERCEEMLFRYRARNYPDTLNEDERERWEQHRVNRLMAVPPATPALTFAQFAPLLEQAAMRVADDPIKLQWIHELQMYAESIFPVVDY
jgi:exodeoxyribonuclease-1